MNAAIKSIFLFILLQNLASFCSTHENVFFQLQQNKCCNKIKQNIYSIAAFILLHMKPRVNPTLQYTSEAMQTAR